MEIFPEKNNFLMSLDVDKYKKTINSTSVYREKEMIIALLIHQYSKIQCLTYFFSFLFQMRMDSIHCKWPKKKL